MKLAYTLILLGAIIKGLLAQENIQPTFITDSLDAYVQRAMVQWEIPAVAVGIVKNGAVVYEKAWGVKSYSSAEAVDVNTLFMIGSNTKAFTATAIAKLDAEGVLSLDDKVSKWIPGFTMYDALAQENINLTDILCHRTGMETFQGDFMFFDTDLTTQGLMDKFGKLKPVYPFRTQWGYCNAGYVLAGEVIKKATSLTWNDYFDSLYFKPLQMHQTVSTVEGIRRSTNACKPFTSVDGKLVEIPYGGLDLTGPAATISSSISNMNHWTTMLLDSGRFQGHEVIPFNAIERTRNPESIIGKNRHLFNKTHYALYGLGWELFDYENHGIVAHTGGVHGFLSAVTLVPDEQLAVVVLTNTDQNAFFQAVKWEIIDAYLALPYRNYSDTYLDYFMKQAELEQKERDEWNAKVEEKLKPALPLKLFEGVYENRVYGKAEIKANNKELILTLEHHPNLIGNLQYIGDNQFLCTFSNPVIGVKSFPFIVHGNAVKSFTLSVPSYLDLTAYEFVKVK